MPWKGVVDLGSSECIGAVTFKVFMRRHVFPSGSFPSIIPHLGRLVLKNGGMYSTATEAHVL